MYNPYTPESPSGIVYRRNPTAGELSFGYGAVHYREFEREEVTKPDGSLKKRHKAKDDGLIYTR